MTYVGKELEKRQRLLDSMNQHALEKIKTWDDVYAHFDGLCKRFLRSGSGEFALDALFSLYAFIIAMKEMPEEGDIQSLVVRMNNILVMEGPEKLGIELQVLELSPQQQAKVGLVSLISHLANIVVTGVEQMAEQHQAEEKKEEGTPEQAQNAKKHLH